ncbi:MAG: RNA polymerase sigma factor [Gemmatimonadota bacterium]
MTLTEAGIDELLQQARAGNEAAFASLIAGVRERVYRWALVITRDGDDADDVAQQVWITLHRRLHDFEGRARFSTWLYTIVRNTAIELMHKPARRYETSRDEAQLPLSISTQLEDQLSKLANQNAATMVRSFFSELPRRQRELIELIDAEGYTAAEAAQMMGIEPETARVHLMRARRALRTRMLELHPEMFT